MRYINTVTASPQNDPHENKSYALIPRTTVVGSLPVLIVLWPTTTPRIPGTEVVTPSIR